MEAFHNNPLIKEYYFNRLNKHYQADEIVKGIYWQNGKGCAVGCTIHSSSHKNYESELGIPENIANLQDRIFEQLPNKLAKEFPLQFLSAIKVGANLSKVSKLFTIWLLTDIEYGVLQYAENKKVIQDIADAFVQDMVSPVSIEKWLELRKNAKAAADFNTDYTASYAYSSALYYASAAYSVKNTKSEWYIAASKKLIELLKEAN